MHLSDNSVDVVLKCGSTMCGTTTALVMAVGFSKTIQTSNKNFTLNVGMEKEQKQELGWRVSVLPIPAFHHCGPLCVACTQCTVECRNG